MNDLRHQPTRNTPLRHLLLLTLILLGLAGAGCNTAPAVGTALFEGPQGTVYLQHLPDRAFQASHPITLEPALLARILQGLQIQERERVLQSLLAGSPSPVSVFSEDQIHFLAPLIAEGLRTATPDQRVEYRLRAQRNTLASESSSVETTAGSVYAYGPALYVSLSQYRYEPSLTNTDDIAHRRLPDSSGMANRTLIFTPLAAVLPGTSRSGERLVAIDLRLLQESAPSAKAPVQAAPQAEPLEKPVPAPQAAVRPSAPPAVSAELLEAKDAEIRSLKDLVIKKDLELDALKNELQSSKRQPGNRATAPQDGSARKNKRPPSRQEPTP